MFANWWTYFTKIINQAEQLSNMANKWEHTAAYRFTKLQINRDERIYLFIELTKNKRIKLHLVTRHEWKRTITTKTKIKIKVKNKLGRIYTKLTSKRVNWVASKVPFICRIQSQHTIHNRCQYLLICRHQESSMSPSYSTSKVDSSFIVSMKISHAHHHQGCRGLRPPPVVDHSQTSPASPRLGPFKTFPLSFFLIRSFF